MGWNPFLQYNFDNHAAVDDTGNGHTGVVSLPSAACWVDAPAAAVTTAIRYDDDRSQVTVPQSADMSGWAGFRTQAVFSAAAFTRRLNLVEGDGSFALFVEHDASLRGTINDGTNWYGVQTSPGVIQPGGWHVAEFSYNPATTLVLRLDGAIVDVLVTHGDPVLPVGPAGIKVGYWPGGDGRYTYAGLMGPVGIDLLDPVQDAATVFGKVVCPAGGYQLETLQQIYEQSLSPAERAHAQKIGVAIVDAAEAVSAAMTGSTGNLQALTAAGCAIEAGIANLLLADEQSGTDIFTDPALPPLLNQGLDLVWSASANARDTLLVQGLKVAALVEGFGMDRAAELRKRNPGLCATAPSTGGFDPGGLVSGGLGGILGGSAPGGGGAGSPGGAGGGPAGGAGTGGCTQSNGTGSGTPGTAGAPGTPGGAGCGCGPAAAARTGSVTIHVDCNQGAHS